VEQNFKVNQLGKNGLEHSPPSVGLDSALNNKTSPFRQLKLIMLFPPAVSFRASAWYQRIIDNMYQKLNNSKPLSHLLLSELMFWWASTPTDKFWNICLYFVADKYDID